MGRAILMSFLFFLSASFSLAGDPARLTYLTGNEVVTLSHTDRLHYVVGLLDAWLLEASISHEGRFGWLVGCLDDGVGRDAQDLEEMFQGFLRSNSAALDQAGSELFFYAVHDFCQPLTD